MSPLKLQKTLHHSSVSWEITVLYFFSWNCTWFGQKEPIKVQNFNYLTAHVKFHQICTLIDSFCWKYIKFQLKKYIGVMSTSLKSDAKLEEKLICFKNDKHLVNFDPSTQEVSKICTLIGSYCGKYLMFDLKLYRGVIFYDTEEWCKIWRKTDLWYEGFADFHQSSQKCQNWDFDGVQNRKCTSLKFTGVIYHDNEEWCKIWWGIDLKFQNWHEEFDEFWSEHLKI